MANGSIDLAGNLTQVVAGQPAAQAYSGVEATTIIALLIPLAILIYILHWGSRKAKRKDKALEVSYNLVALEIIMLVLSPLCSNNMCIFGAAIPVAMLIALMFFAYHRKRRDREYAADVAKAISEGHVRPDSLIQKKFQEEIGAPKPKRLHHKLKHHVKKKAEAFKARIKTARAKKEKQPAAAEQPAPTRRHWLAKYAEGMGKPAKSPKPPEEPAAEPQQPQAEPEQPKKFPTPKWLTRSLESAPHKAPHESWSYRPPTDRPKRTGPKEVEREAADHIIRHLMDKKPGEPGSQPGA
jgi:hypothetical protein